MFITKQQDLEDFARRARTSSVLAIDTEFMREDTYYARLCLLQMQTDDETVIVDPFEVRDLSVLAPVMADGSVLKLFHAGSQDIEIVFREVGEMPRPVFDTQVAAALLGHTQQVGYGALVGSLCGVTLRKTDSFTDWSRRPLTPSQIDYAADDVVYLPRMYEKMAAELERLGRTRWLDADFAALCDPATYDPNPSERWRRLKRVSSLSRRQLSAAQRLAEWRELRAMKIDSPRKWVLSDEQLVEACKREPRSIDELYMVRGMRDRLTLDLAREVLAAIEAGLDAPSDTWPRGELPAKNEANVDVELDVMNALVRLRARENGIAFQTLASHADLVAVARGYRDVDILRGWRRDIVGDELLELLDGKLALSFDYGSVKVTKLRQ